jgi:Zn-finger nucleic acid-binding protein
MRTQAVAAMLCPTCRTGLSSDRRNRLPFVPGCLARPGELDKMAERSSHRWRGVVDLRNALTKRYADGGERKWHHLC